MDQKVDIRYLSWLLITLFAETGSLAALDFIDSNSLDIQFAL